MGPNAHPLLASDMYKNMTTLAGLQCTYFLASSFQLRGVSCDVDAYLHHVTCLSKNLIFVRRDVKHVG